MCLLAVRTGPSQKSDCVSSFTDETFGSTISHLGVTEFKYGPEHRLSRALASLSVTDPNNVVIIPYVRSGARPSISFTSVYLLLTHPFKVVQPKPVFLKLSDTAGPTKLSINVNPSPRSRRPSDPEAQLAATFEIRIITNNTHTHTHTHTHT